MNYPMRQVTGLLSLNPLGLWLEVRDGNSAVGHVHLPLNDLFDHLSRIKNPVVRNMAKHALREAIDGQTQPLTFSALSDVAGMLE